MKETSSPGSPALWAGASVLSNRVKVRGIEEQGCFRLKEMHE
jgi:hypothetical protein